MADKDETPDPDASGTSPYQSPTYQNSPDQPPPEHSNSDRSAPDQPPRDQSPPDPAPDATAAATPAPDPANVNKGGTSPGGDTAATSAPPVPQDQSNTTISSTDRGTGPTDTHPAANPPGTGDTAKAPAANTDYEEKTENYHEFLAAGKRAHADFKLRDTLLAEAGDTLRNRLTRYYATDTALGPGLHILVAPFAFSLAALAGQSATPPGAKSVRVGQQIDLAFTADLKNLAERYKDDRCLAVIIEDEALRNGLFWKTNRDLEAVDTAARGHGLSMTLMMTPRLRDGLDSDADLLDLVAVYETRLDPPPETALERLLTDSGLDGAAHGIKPGGFPAGSDAFAEIFRALRENDSDTLINLLKNEGLSDIETEWRAIFERVAIDGQTREPAAAAALFIAANMPDLPARLFNHVWVILHNRLADHWPPPVIIEDRDTNPRDWREYRSDEALAEVGISMAPSAENGMRRARFSSAIITRRYEEWFAANAQSLFQKLCEDLFDVVKPLDLGVEVIEPSSSLFARLLRDTHGTGTGPALLAREYAAVIAGHRSAADRAIVDASHQRKLFESSQSSGFKVIEAELRALETERDADHLKDFAPRFVLRSLQDYTGGDDPDLHLDVAHEIWALADAGLQNVDARIVDFWRHITTAMVYAADPEHATTRLGRMYRHDTRAFFTLGYAVSQSLDKRALLRALSAAAAAFTESKGIEKVWSFGNVTALSTLWMHLAANAGPDGDPQLTRPDLASVIGKAFLSKSGPKWLQGLSEMTREVARAQKIDRDTLREGTLARSLAIAQLRLLCGFVGSHFDRFARSLDQTGPTRSAGFRTSDRWTSDASDRFPDFDAWRRDQSASTGAAMIVGASAMSGDPPSDWVAWTCDAAPDAHLAAKILQQGARRLLGHLKQAADATEPDAAERHHYLRTQTGLASIRDTAAQRVSES